MMSDVQFNSTPDLNTQEGSQEKITIEATVGEGPQFQSILFNEIYTHKEGHSLARTAAVSLLALPLIPLIAVYDLARYGLFKLGKCDGRSWSLIDKAGLSVQQTAEKVSQLMKKKELTLDEKNTLSSQKMRGHVKEIVEGYRKQNGNWYNHFYDSPKAVDGEKQIQQHQEELIREMQVYLARNAQSPEQFISIFQEIKEHISVYFSEVAKDDFYIENKVERKGLRPRLAAVAMKEFEQALRNSEGFSNAYLSRVQERFDLQRMMEKQQAGVEGVTENANENFFGAVIRGVEKRIFNAEAVNKAVYETARELYAETLIEEGANSAQEKTHQFFDTGARVGLISTPIETHQEKVQFTPQELGILAAQNVIRHEEQNPGTEEAALSELITLNSTELKGQGKLAPQDELEFVKVAIGQVKAYQAEKDAVAKELEKAEQENQAILAQQAQQDAEAQAAQIAKEEAAQVEAAQKAELAQKLETERQNLFTVLSKFLNQITEKQKALLGRYDDLDGDYAKRNQLLSLMNETWRRKVTVGKDKKEMTVMQAFDYQRKKVAEIISANKDVQTQEAKLTEFQSEFGDEAIAIIAQLQEVSQMVIALTQEMSEKAKGIDEEDKSLAQDVVSYRALAKKEKSKLDEAQGKEISQLEKRVKATQNRVRERYRALHNVKNPFAALPADKVAPYEVNPEAFLSQEAEIAPGESPSLLRRLWNGMTFPVSYAAHKVGLA